MIIRFTLILILSINSYSILFSEVIFNAEKWMNYDEGKINGQNDWENYGTQKAGETRMDEIAVRNGESKSVEVNFNTMAQDVRLDLGYTLSGGKSIFYGISFSIASLGQSDYFIGFQNKQSGQTPHLSRLFISTLNPGMTGDFALGITTNGQNKQSLSLWNEGLLFNEVYTAVVGYDFDTGFSSLWLNPMSLDDTSIISQDAVIGRSISRAFFRSGEATNNQINIYDLIISDNFEEMLYATGAIPEPLEYSFFIGIAGFLSILVRRIRRK